MSGRVTRATLKRRLFETDASEVMAGAGNLFSHPPSPGGTGLARARDRGSADGVSSLGLGLAFVAPTGIYIYIGGQ